MNLLAIAAAWTTLSTTAGLWLATAIRNADQADHAQRGAAA